jgi:hypothetical protein
MFLLSNTQTFLGGFDYKKYVLKYKRKLIKMAYWNYDYIFLLAGIGRHWFLNKLFSVWLDGASPKIF